MQLGKEVVKAMQNKSGLSGKGSASSILITGNSARPEQFHVYKDEEVKW